MTTPTRVSNALVESTLGGCLQPVACPQGKWGPVQSWAVGGGQGGGGSVGGSWHPAEGAGAEGPADTGAPRCVPGSCVDG